MTAWGKFTIQLGAGVAAFFVISGFLLDRPFVAARVGGNPVRLGAYARRRAASVSYYLVELPFLRCKEVSFRSVWRRVRPAWAP
jgi:peptidoglycan/LPS O-acetylase OafA/YrhL